MPVWIFLPEGKMLSPDAQSELASSQAEIHPFQIDDAILKFPFALKTLASAEAERMAENQQCILAWHDLTGFICNPPLAFNLPETISLRFSPHGYCQYWCTFWTAPPPFLANHL